MKSSRTSRHTHFQKGFTLVEMIVALMIFSVVATVALGAVIKIISANRKAQTLQSAVTNMNFALDAISRDLRVGSSYYCYKVTPAPQLNPGSFSPQSCAGYGGGDVNLNNDVIFAFLSAQTDPTSSCNLYYVYKFTSDPAYSNKLMLEKAQQQNCGDYLGTDQNPFTPIISPDVTLTGFKLSVTNSAYPLAFIKLAGYAGNAEKDKTYFDIQTAVSPRTP
ncbi:MAG: type II secretion system protein [Candidatus Taylorbacteria bacterium]